MLKHSCHATGQETEAGGSQKLEARVTPSQAGLPCETVSPEQMCVGYLSSPGVNNSTADHASRKVAHSEKKISLCTKVCFTPLRG